MTSLDKLPQLWCIFIGNGEYVEKQSFLFDCKCFFGTIFSVLRHDGVVEGGTGELHKAQEEQISEKEGAVITVNKGSNN